MTVALVTPVEATVVGWIYDGDSLPVQGAILTFKSSQEFFRDGNHYNIDEEVITDANGKFSISLYSTKSGSLALATVSVRIEYENTEGNDVIDSFDIVVDETLVDVSNEVNIQALLADVDTTIIFSGPQGPIGPTGPAGSLSTLAVVDSMNPVELNAENNLTVGDFVEAVETVAGGQDIVTTYAYNANNTTGLNAQFIVATVDGGNTRWVAVGGRYTAQAVQSIAQQNYVPARFDTVVSLPSATTYHGMFAHVHDMSDPLGGQRAYFAHASTWWEIKDYRRSQAYVNLAAVDISFGAANRFLSKTLAGNTTLTASDLKIDEHFKLKIDGNFTLTFPSGTVVIGEYDGTTTNYIDFQCKDTAGPEFQSIIYQDGAKFLSAADKIKLDGIDTGAEVNPDVISQAEAEAGTATTERIWTAQRVSQAIAALETGGAPTKQYYASAGGDTGNQDNYSIKASGSTAQTYLSFHVPHDFTSLTSLVVITSYLGALVAVDIDLNSSYSASGESTIIHQESDTTSTYTANANETFLMDISGVFSSIAAGDICGLNIDHNGIGTTGHYKGVLMRYT